MPDNYPNEFVADESRMERGFSALGWVFHRGHMTMEAFLIIDQDLPGLIPDVAAVRRSIFDGGPIPADTVLTMIQYASGGRSWNPRYVAYARAHGKRPEDMLAADKLAFPGGCMGGFICWIWANLARFAAAHPEAMIGGHVSDQGAWTAWLEKAQAIVPREPSTVFVCGPKPTCPDGTEHQMDGWENFEGPNGSVGGTAVCSKCGHRAIDEANWM
jgi:hypothetical protein